MSDQAPSEAAARRELWQALGLVADWLVDADPASGWGGLRSKDELPEIAAFEAPPRRPAIVAAGRGSDPAGREPRRSEDGIDLAEDERLAATCRACRLGEGRTRVAYGEGSRHPLVLVVGEGPGAEEDAQGRPFVGAAGKLLDRMLLSIGLSRDTNCYIANIVKCRPPGNRDPAPDEREACLSWLERQILALGPRVILAMGRVAASTLLGSDEAVGRLRGRWYERGGIPLLATYHPSALLRDESYKRPAWEDLKTLKFRLDDLDPER